MDNASLAARTVAWVSYAWPYLPVLAAWVAMFIYMVPAVLSIYVRQGRHGDPARLFCFLVATLMMGFVGRRAIVREPIDQPLAVLLVISTFTALYGLHLAGSYGRGRRV